MGDFVLCADPGITPDGTKGASVHLRSIASAFARRRSLTMFTRRAPQTAVSLPFPVEALGDWPSLVDAADRLGVPDLVYERYSLGHLGGLRAARALDRPFVLEVNAPLVMEAQRHRPGTVSIDDQEAERVLWREADLLVAVSTSLLGHVRFVRGDKPAIVVPNACDPELFTTRPPEDPRPTIGFLGHPKPWHGTERLPWILRSVRESGRDARLLVVGGGPGAVSLQRQAEKAGVADHVEVTGPLPQREAIEHIGRAWVGVAPYRHDPFFYFSPIKVIEYLAAGLPVVASALGDIPDVVADAGITVAPEDIDGFVAAIGSILDDDARRAEMGRRGRERTIRERTWDAAAGLTLSAADDLAIGASR
jgi:glycosyltransferase involved in cell wall biosynthesis